MDNSTMVAVFFVAWLATRLIPSRGCLIPLEAFWILLIASGAYGMGMGQKRAGKQKEEE